jgi:hypothetical protein
MVLLQQSSPASVEGPTVLRCCHHWIIEPADGPVSLGTCRFCHESREFKNSIAEAEPDYRNPGASYGSGFRDRDNVPVE